MARQTRAKAAPPAAEKVSERSVEEIEADLQLPSSSDEDLSVEEGSDVEELSEDSDEDIASDSESESEELEGSEEPEQEQEQEQEIVHKVTKSKPSTSASASSKSNKAKGVIYLGRIPHGFHENEMKKYFDQFGDISRLRLSRNKKTGKSKHYGFIEFTESEVAKVAAETMNNYLLFGHLLKCHVVPKEDVHDDLFKGSATTYKAIPWLKVSKNKHDSAKSKTQWEKLSKKHQQAQRAKIDKLKAKGIDFDLTSIV